MSSKVWIDFATIKPKSKSTSELVCVCTSTQTFIYWRVIHMRKHGMHKLWWKLNLNPYGFRLWWTRQNYDFGFVSKTKSRPTITPDAGWTIRGYSNPFPCIYWIIVVSDCFFMSTSMSLYVFQMGSLLYRVIVACYFWLDYALHIICICAVLYLWNIVIFWQIITHLIN